MAKPTVTELIIQRLDRLEEKVDRLLTFRAWLLGAGAAAGGLASIIVSWLQGR